MTKITNISALETAIATLSTIEGVNAEVITKLGNIKASYEKKNSGERKPTETQKLNEVIKSNILTILADTPRMTVTELCKALEGDYTNQKISRLANDLVKDGKLVKIEDKRKTYFSLV